MSFIGNIFGCWLYDHGVGREFLRNFAFANDCDYNDWITLVSPENYISDAFRWETTPQGYDFWLRLYAKWNDYYSSVILGG